MLTLSAAERIAGQTLGASMLNTRSDCTYGTPNAELGAAHVDVRLKLDPAANIAKGLSKVINPATRRYLKFTWLSGIGSEALLTQAPAFSSTQITWISGNRMLELSATGINPSLATPRVEALVREIASG